MMEQKWDRCHTYASLMMKRRGYGAPEPVGEEDDAYILRDSRNKSVLVWYFKHDKMNIDSIKEFVQMLEESSIQHGVIVYQSTITSSTKKVIENLFQFTIELFELRELLYDITEFKYFCKHEKLVPPLSVEVRKKFGTGLPSLLRTDPVVRYYHFHKGDIIRVTRRNGMLTYRLVK